MADNESELSDEDVKRALASVAFHIQCHNTGGAIEHGEAVAVLQGFLRDEHGGFGIAKSDARWLSRRLLDIGEGSTGLLVKRSAHEIGFFHRTFQEFLAAMHLSESSVEEQKSLVSQHCGNPQWHETLMCLLHLTRRRQDVSSFVDLVEQEYGSADVLRQQAIEALLAEIAFGNVGCPPIRAREIAKATFSRIERGDWMPQRERLLRIALDGYRVPPVKGPVREKIAEWFPCRATWRAGIYTAMSEWPRSEDVVQCLWRAIHEEEVSNQRSAAAALAKLARGEEQIGDQLAEVAASHPRPIVRAVALEGLIHGWPNHRCLPDAVAAAHASVSPELRVISILDRVNRGNHNDADRDTLIELASFENGLRYGFQNVLVYAILKGWPNSGEVKEACLQGGAKYFQRGRGQVDKDIAFHVLLQGFQGDADVAELCIREIRERDHPFISMRPWDTWALLADGFSGNAELCNAVEDWLEKQTLNGPEVYEAALLTRSDRTKRKLLSLLEEGFRFWSVRALLEVWGMGDEEVAKPLTALAFGDNGRAAAIGCQLPRVIRDRSRCRERLFELLEDESIRRPDFVLRAIVELGIEDLRIDIVALTLNKVLSRCNISHSEIASLKATLMAAYPNDPRVKAVAKEELDGRLADLASVSVAQIAAAYPDDEAIRRRILRIASPLPDSLRRVAVSQLRASTSDDAFALSLFGAYDYEEDDEIKTEASIGYHERVKSSQSDLAPALADLAESIVCYGPDHEARRQAAFCGLVELNRLDVMKEAEEKIGANRLCAITLMSRNGGPNVPLVRCLLANWTQIKNALGETFWERLSKGGGHPGPWGYLWGLADQYDLPREEGLELIASKSTKALDSTALQFVARCVPRSRLLLQCCLDTLHIGDDRADVSGESAVLAAEILGRDFAGDQEALSEILAARRQDRFFEKEILAFCEAWPHHELLRNAYEWVKSTQRSMNRETYFRLVCRVGAADEVEQLLLRACAARRLPPGSYWRIGRPFVRRLAANEELVNRLLYHLQASSGASEKVSLFRLLSAAVGATPDLRAWAKTELKRQLDDPEVGMDILAGEIRSVVHAILDGLLPHYGFGSL